VIGVIVLMQLMFAFGVWDYSAGYEGRLAAEFGAGTNTGELGAILYDDYILIFQLAGLVLLVAMIGAIVLTLRHRVDVKRQDVIAQMMRDPAKAMELKDVKPGQGL
jgi:NADH-quinone oxidoreductase subunit J